MHNSVSERLCHGCDKLVMILLCVLMADCAVFGAGRTVSVGPIGFRMLLLAAIMIVSIPLVIKHFGMLIRNKFLWILAAFAAWLAVETVLGLAKGNSISLLAADLKGFAYFAAVLPVLCVLNTKKRVRTLMKVIMYASAVLAAAAFVLLFLYNWAPQIFNMLYRMDSEFNITMFSAVSSRIPRLFFKSTPYLLYSCSAAVYFQLNETQNKFRWHYSLIAGFSLFALLLSYTRSIYLAVLVAAVFLTVMLCLCGDKRSRKRLAGVLGAAVIVCVVLIFASSVILGADYFGYALDRLGVTFSMGEESPWQGNTDIPATEPDVTEPDVTEPDHTSPGDTDGFQQATIESDKFRALTMRELMHNIRSSPIWGHGLGKELEVRGGEANEYIYQDIWMKTGIIGLLLYFAPAVWMVIESFRKIRKEPENMALRGAWLAVLLGFMTFSYFNPYMNASLGILFYCCCIGVYHAKEISDPDTK